MHKRVERSVLLIMFAGIYFLANGIMAMMLILPKFPLTVSDLALALFTHIVLNIGFIIVILNKLSIIELR